MKKILYFVFAVSIIIWLGGSLIRNVIIFDVFVPGSELQFKPDFTDEIINYNIKLFVSSSVYTNIAYGFSFFSVLILIYLERQNLKKEGWLFMSFIIYLIASPVIIFNIFADYGMSMAIFYNDMSYLDSDIKTEIFNRYKSNWNTVLSGISYLSVITILIFNVWKPLNLRDLNPDNEK